jgi:hypothetical protein
MPKVVVSSTAVHVVVVCVVGVEVSGVAELIRNCAMSVAARSLTSGTSWSVAGPARATPGPWISSAAGTPA